MPFCGNDILLLFPTCSGIHRQFVDDWIPAFAGMTVDDWIPIFMGMTFCCHPRENGDPRTLPSPT